MKKLLLALAICISSTGFAQIMQVNSVQKLNLSANENRTVVGFSPKGDYILLSSGQNVGLTKFDLASGASTVLTSAPGAGFDAKISGDGNTVLFRESSIAQNHLRFTSLKSKNLTANTESVLVPATRDLQGYSVDNQSAASVTKGKFAVKSFSGVKASLASPVLSINNRQLMMTINGKTKVFSPNGKEYSYLWPSVSPDGSKILYYVGGIGAFVCNLDGSNITKIGKIRAPRWYNANIIIGMNDKDNGTCVTSSSIVAANLNGVTQTLTDDSCIAMYPYASADGSKIVFSTPQGDAYMININNK